MTVMYYSVRQLWIVLWQLCIVLYGAMLCWCGDSPVLTLMRRMHRHQLAPLGVKRRAALARCNSLPAGTASHTEDQPVTSKWCPPVTAVGLFPYCRLKQVGRLHMWDVPSKMTGKATHALQCFWTSITASWQHVCLRQERCNSVICGTLPNSQ